MLEWFIRWLETKPDSQRSLLKRLASYAIDPGVVYQYVYRIAREVEHNAVAFLHIAHARIKLLNFGFDAGMVSVFFTAIGAAGFLVGSLLMLPETAASAD